MAHTAPDAGSTPNRTPVSATPGAIDELLSRSIAEVLPSEGELRALLLEGRRLHVYMGIDPTAPYVHIGHSTNYLILERLHRLGHRITVLVGDFTAMIGDPSDKASERVQLSREQVTTNLQSFREQIGKVLDLDSVTNPIAFRFNSEWLAKLDFHDAVDLAANFTVQQMLERETFRRRVDDGKPLHVHELMYPLMQGYDSVALEVDLEVGGMDQKFNMLAGRTLLRRLKDRNKFVLLSTLLVNPRTGEKLMSKSLGTGVALNDPPEEMFFKVMRLPDEGIIQTFIDCTRLPLVEIADIEARLGAGANPRDEKLRLACELVSMYHGEARARGAEAEWRSQMSDRRLPSDLASWRVSDATLDVVAWLKEIGAVSSSSAARRLVEGGGVRHNDEKVLDLQIQVSTGDVVRAGKKRVYRFVVG